MSHTFRAVLHKEGDLFVADCPEAGTVSQGATIEEALSNLKEATELYLEEFPQDQFDRSFMTTLASIDSIAPMASETHGGFPTSDELPLAALFPTCCSRNVPCLALFSSLKYGQIHHSCQWRIEISIRLIEHLPSFRETKGDLAPEGLWPRSLLSNSNISCPLSNSWMSDKFMSRYEKQDLSIRLHRLSAILGRLL